MKLKIKFLSHLAQEIYSQNPLKYETFGSAGIDIRAIKMKTIEGGEIDLKVQNFILKPQARVLIQVGFATEFEAGYELQIRPRSGLAWQNGITVINSPGTIDSDYRGEIGVIILNTSDIDFEVTLGDRIAQMIVAKYEIPLITLTDEISDSQRGSGGLGSTGI